MYRIVLYSVYRPKISDEVEENNFDIEDIARAETNTLPTKSHNLETQAKSKTS
jgi:hypothetical protein